MADNDFLEFKRIQWTNSAGTLSRIKADEQKWLFYAFAAFGGFFSLYLSGKATLPGTIDPKHAVLVFNCIAVVLEIFILFWIGQSLTLRQQYYTAMGRLFTAEIQLGEVPPESWRFPPKEIIIHKKLILANIYIFFGRICWIPRDKYSEIKNKCLKSNNQKDKELNIVLCHEIASANHWRNKATGPRDSKFYEILMVIFLFGITLIPIYFSLAPKDLSDNFSLLLSLACYFLLSFLFWPFVVYPVFDRYKLQKVYWGDVKRIQLTFHPSIDK